MANKTISTDEFFNFTVEAQGSQYILKPRNKEISKIMGGEHKVPFGTLNQTDRYYYLKNYSRRITLALQAMGD